MSHQPTFTDNEQARLRELAERISRLRAYLAEKPFEPGSMSLTEVYEYLAAMRQIQGNASNAASYVACLMAKAYLNSHLEMRPFDAGLKPEGAPGLDVEAETVNGRRVAGEIKTTYPYGANDLGAQQKATFEKDFEKLNKADADLKFFFVTEPRTFEIVVSKYSSRIPGVRIVCLTTGAEFAVERAEER